MKKPERVSGVLLHSSLLTPLRQDLSLSLGLAFSWLGWGPANLSDPLVALIRHGMFMPSLSRVLESSPHDFEVVLFLTQAPPI